MSATASQVVFSFDTTGSNYPALAVVQREIKDFAALLLGEHPNLEIAVVAHGDYGDAGVAPGYYDVRLLDFTRDVNDVHRFVNETRKTNGFANGGECYELALHRMRTELSWKAGAAKVIALIGDEPAHEIGARVYGGVPHGRARDTVIVSLDWRNELDLLVEAGVSVYGVQCLRHQNGRRYNATEFYAEVARRTSGYHLHLDQFGDVVALIEAVILRVDSGALDPNSFEEQFFARHRRTRTVSAMVDTLLGRTSTFQATYDADLVPVPPSRFQVLRVTRDTPIADFVRATGAEFRKGRGFYELTKRVVVQDYKEVVLRHRQSGDFFSGAEARRIVGLPQYGTAKLSPVHLADWQVFIQSTSANRKLLAGTDFLYEA